jgi:hypothetical protein
MTTYERSTLNEQRKVYIGLDVHQATISAAVMDSQGRLVMESILETKSVHHSRGLERPAWILSVTFEEGCRSPKSKVGMTVHSKKSFLGPKKCPSLLSVVSLRLWLLLVAAI